MILSERIPNIPDELKKINQWVGWRYAQNKDGKKTKIPIDARTGRKASSTDPNTWSDLSTVLASTYRFDGIAIVLTKDLGIVGIDLDNCLDDAGQLSEFATKIVKRMNGYTEISPSGRGLKIFVRGNLPGRGRKKPEHGFEIYDNARVMTITGNRYDLS